MCLYEKTRNFSGHGTRPTHVRSDLLSVVAAMSASARPLIVLTVIALECLCRRTRGLWDSETELTGEGWTFGQTDCNRDEACQISNSDKFTGRARLTQTTWAKLVVCNANVYCRRAARSDRRARERGGWRQ